MALYFRRRRRTWRPRWRRRGYWRRSYRSALGRRFRRRRRTRRRSRIRVRVLTERQPRYWRRCTIRGWWPVLITGRKYPSTAAQGDDAGTQMLTFKPFQPFGSKLSNAWFYRDYEIVLGGFSAGTFSLQALYMEHLMCRNRWSQSNCGFDLASYRGTKLYFQPHPNYDYIVLIDPEYRKFEQWIKQPMHPGVLITHPQSRIIRSISHAGPRRKMPKMFVPPPSTMNSGWQWMGELANEGLFAFYVQWIDLGAPWLGDVQNPNQVKWWKTGDATTKPDWVTKGIEMQGKTVQEGLDAYYTQAGQAGKKWVNPGGAPYQLGFGPFVFKGSHTGDQEHYPQICFFYKSYWQWGGSTTSIKNVCDPKDNPNAEYKSAWNRAAHQTQHARTNEVYNQT
uniref:Capsid protein n=1 Tax=Anelloviridae sp. TaxID=2055263 RepID=A0A2H4R0J8_9VIRU|nr:ORF1 [Anelloviridae sp.]